VLRRRVGEGDTGAAAFVPCHGDVHTHNVLVDAGGSPHIVDWDELSMAPPERDLMFVLGSPIGLAPGEREAGLFLRGYGPLEIDPVHLAYYHADWAIQDLVGYAARVLVTDFGRDSRAEAMRIFTSIFDPGGEVDVALRTEAGRHRAV
jgi:spectinomycin phosphotransferase